MTENPATNLDGIQRDEKGRIVKGAILNPDGVGGFGERPEDRSDGRWKAENTFTYQMNKFKQMTIKELEEWNTDTPKEVRTVAQDLAFRRVFNARDDIQEFREVADRTEGKAPQTVILDNGLFSDNILEITVIDDTNNTEQETEPST